MTFVKATYVLAKFVHISNISAVTDPILNKLFGPNFLGVIIFVLGPNFFGPKFFQTQNLFQAQNLWSGNFIGLTKIVRAQKNFQPKFFQTQIFFTPKIFFGLKYFGQKKFGPKIKAPQNFGSISLVEIGSVTAEILLIWTNVARAYEVIS